MNYQIDDGQTFTYQQIDSILNIYPKWRDFENVLFIKRLYTLPKSFNVIRSVWHFKLFSDLTFKNNDFLNEKTKNDIDEKEKQNLELDLRMFGITEKIWNLKKSEKVDENDNEIILIDGNHRLSTLALRFLNGKLKQDLSVTIYVGTTIQ
jgi:hypothetical protein